MIAADVSLVSCAPVGRCVLQFQTFSVALNSAIGFYNYKYYVLTLLYGSLAALWALSTTLPELIASWPRMTATPPYATGPAATRAHGAAYGAIGDSWIIASDGLTAGHAQQWVVDVVLMITAVVALTLLIPCASLMAVHAWLVGHGYTMYEWQQMRRGRRPYARSLYDYRLAHNLALTLGMYPLLWLLPTRRGVDGNGIFYPEQERGHGHERCSAD